MRRTRPTPTHDVTAPTEEPRTAQEADASSAWRTAGGALLALGALLQIWLWLRSWIYFDQILLVQLGVEWTNQHTLLPFAKAVSGAGVIPGALLQLLVGLPLDVWYDLRSPSLLLGALQVAAGVLLWRTVARHYGETAATLFVAVYWLGPWRLYHSGFLWEPTYLLLPAALHFWASLAQAESASRGASFTLGAVAIASIQLHPSGAVLALATLLLWARRKHHLHLPSTAAGAVLASVTLWPTAAALVTGALPRVLPQSSFTDLGIVRVHPLLKDLGYWLRLGSLDVGRRLRQIERPDLDVAIAVLVALAALSVVVAAIANVAFVRARPRSPAQAAGRSYLLAVLVAHLAFVGVSSVTPQGWHMLVALHAASLPVALFLAPALTRAPRWARATLWLFLLTRLPIVVLLGLGHPMYVAPADDPNREAAQTSRLEEIELVPIPFGSSASVRGPVPWEAPDAPENEEGL